MKKEERIKKKIADNKDISQAIQKQGFYTVDQFIHDGKRYIKAIKEGRIICNIDSVSRSGMSRTIKFLECTKRQQPNQYTYYNFFAFFKVMGWQVAGRYKDYFRIHGCGMDMIFHTNYTNIHRLHRLGFITKQQCRSLAQQTPSLI